MVVHSTFGRDHSFNRDRYVTLFQTANCHDDFHHAVDNSHTNVHAHGLALGRFELIIKVIHAYILQVVFKSSLECTSSHSGEFFNLK